MERDTKPSIQTRQSLLSRLKDWGDDDSWRTFFDTYWKMIYDVARRSGLTDAEAQDAVQETVLSVAKTIPGFKYDASVGSFKAWLLNLSRWRINDQFRKRKGMVSASSLDGTGEGETDFMDRQPDPGDQKLEVLWDEEWQKHIFEMAQERVKRQATPKDYQIFHLWVLRKIPAREVARSVGVNLARVYVAKNRVSSMMKKEVQRLEKRMSGGEG